MATTPALTQTLEGKSVVVTGTLEGFSREEAEEAIEAQEAAHPGSVSKRTTAVVVGLEPGASKLSKAEEIGVPVIDEPAFEEAPGHRRAALGHLEAPADGAGGVSAVADAPVLGRRAVLAPR